MKTLLPVILFLLIASWSPAQPPPGYYDAADGLTGLQLQQALHDIIDDHTVINYSDIYTYFILTDIKPDSTVWDMYSDIPGGVPPYVFHFIPGDQCGNYSAEGDCFNKEHSWPKSWFGGEVLPMYSDLFHIYPTDGWVNNKRGNYPYGDVGTPGWISLNGSKTGNCSWPGYSSVVFEPVDAFKGDFARTYFYMAVRYFGEDASWPGSDMTQGSQLKPWAVSMLLQWNQDDSVSQKEIDRNNAVFQLQHNRNPFIDRPQNAIDIWGPGAGIPEKNAWSLKIIPNPASNQCAISFPGKYSGQTADIRVYTAEGILKHCFTEIAGNATLINLSSFNTGIYYITVTMNGVKLPRSEKLIVLN